LKANWFSFFSLSAIGEGRKVFEKRGKREERGRGGGKTTGFRTLLLSFPQQYVQRWRRRGSRGGKKEKGRRGEEVRFALYIPTKKSLEKGREKKKKGGKKEDLFSYSIVL